MLQMIAEMETTGEARQGPEIIAPRIVMVSERFGRCLMMGAIGSEVEKLQRREQRRRSIENEYLQEWHIKREPIERNDNMHQQQRLQSEIAFEKGPIPSEEI